MRGVATSLGAGLGVTPLDMLRSARTIETATGVAVGFVVAGFLAYIAQHYVVVQRGTAHGRIFQWCPGSPTLELVPGARVIGTGSAGPASGGVYQSSGSGLGDYALTTPPGLVVLAVVMPDGHQVPPMVLTPRTTAGDVPLASSLELVYDVWAQAIVPPRGAVAVDLVVNC